MYVPGEIMAVGGRCLTLSREYSPLTMSSSVVFGLCSNMENRVQVNPTKMAALAKKYRETRVVPLPRLGGGVNGVAFELSPFFVLKIGRSPDGTAVWLRDAASRYVAGLPPRPGQPRVLAYGSSGDSGYWAVVERVAVECEEAPSRQELSLYSDYRTVFESVSRGLTALGLEGGVDDGHAGNWGHSLIDDRVVVFDPSCSDGRKAPLVYITARHKAQHGICRNRRWH